MNRTREPEPYIADGEEAQSTLTVGDFLWHPLKVKILWFCSFSYWGGVVWAEARPDLLSFFHTVLGGFIGIFLCPPFVLLALIALFLRAWYAQLDMSDWEGLPEPDFFHQQNRSSGGYREFGGPFDPTLDPTDPRSGILHLRHIGVLKH